MKYKREEEEEEKKTIDFKIKWKIMKKKKMQLS